MIIKDIKDQIKEAMKSKDVIKRDVLRLVIGQAQQAGNTTDDYLVKIAKKLVKSNHETIDAITERSLENAKAGTPIVPDEAAKLMVENQVLSQFIPQPMSEDEIKSFIQEKNLDIISAKNDGQAIGLIMKQLKETTKEIEPSLVKKVVQELRS